MPDMDDPARAVGPELVTAGPADGPALLVFDPAGEAIHGEIPATWRELAGRVHVAWARMPAANFDMDRAATFLHDTAAHHQPLHLVTEPPLMADVLRLAADAHQLLGSVLVTDPKPAPEQGEYTERASMDAVGDLTGALQAFGVPVHVIADDVPPEADDKPGPLPLGHPAVVRELTTHLAV